MYGQLFPGFRIVVGRRTPDMSHHYFYFFTHKNKLLRVYSSYIIAINIAIHAFQRFDGRKLIRYLNTPKISGMPDLITILEMLKNSFIKVAMRIRYNAYMSQESILNLSAI